MTDKKLSQLSAGSVVDARDLFYSAPNAGGQVKQTARAVRSYIRPRTLSVDDPAYGVVTGSVSGAQRIANVTGINAAHAAACAAGQDLEFGPYTYQIDGTIVLFDPTTPNGVTGRVPLTKGVRFVTRIEQWNSSGGIDTIRFGPAVGNPNGQGVYGGGVQDIWIASITNQSTTTPLTGHLGAQLAIVSAEQCTFSGLAIGEVNTPVASTTHFAYNAIAMDSVSGAYSCVFRDMEIKGYGNCGFIEYGTSGNYHYNIMIRNGGLGEPSLKTSSGRAFDIFNSEGIFDQINIEWSIFGNAQPAIYAPSSAGLKFGHLHFEGVQISQSFAGARAGFMLLPGASMSRFESIHMISTNLPTGCNLVSVGLFAFGFSANYSNVSVGQLLISQTATLGTGVNFYLVNTYEGAGAGSATNCQVDFVGPCLMFGDGTFSAKLTNWSDCNFAANSQGPANGLGVPPSNFCGRNMLFITTSAYGYSSGTFTASMVDGYDTYLWDIVANGTIVLPLTVMDATLPITLAPYPGTERTIICNKTANLTINNSAGTNLLNTAFLTIHQFARFRFDGANWIQISGGTQQ